MGFFDAFKRPAPPQRDKPAADERPSVKSLLSAVSKGVTSSQMCGLCGERYNHPNQTPLLVIDVKDWELDLGGYCSHCRLYTCPKHVHLVVSGTAEILGSKHDAYARTCATCQTRLTDKEGDDPEVPPPSVFMGGIRLR